MVLMTLVVCLAASLLEFPLVWGKVLGHDDASSILVFYK